MCSGGNLEILLLLWRIELGIDSLLQEVGNSVDFQKIGEPFLGLVVVVVDLSKVQSEVLGLLMK